MKNTRKSQPILTALLGFALTASAFALDLPAGARLEVEAGGRLIGNGYVHQRGVELDLLERSRGEATLKVTTREGTHYYVSVFINRDGSITVMNADGAQELHQILRNSGLRLDLDYDDDLDDDWDDWDDWDDDWDDWDDWDDDRRDRDDDRRDREDDRRDRDDDRRDRDDDARDRDDDRRDREDDARDREDDRRDRDDDRRDRDDDDDDWDDWDDDDDDDD